MSRLLRAASALVLVSAALAPAWAEAAAQEGGPLDPRDVARILREATARESAGDYPGAERLLDGLLARNPTSLGALFALERVLRAQGRAVEVLEPVDALLELEPAAGGARHLQLRILSERDSLDALAAAAQAWIGADPTSPDAYREVARVLSGTFGPERALRVLRSGRRALGDEDALALETGDALAALGELEEAAEEWSRALEGEAVQLSSVMRRLSSLPESQAVARSLAERLSREPTTLARRRAAVRVALGSGLHDLALEGARDVLSDLSPRAARGFLLDLGRRGDEEGGEALALWAYERLRERAEGSAEARSLDARIADAALALGDTARSLEARDRLALAHPEGSPERRRAMASSLRLRLESGSSDGSVQALDAFREAFPDAPELDGLSAALARRFAEAGREERAAVVLEGVEGPASALERGYLALGGADVDGARRELARALPGMEPARATEVVQLLASLDALGPDAREALGRALALERRGRVDEALSSVEEGLAEGTTTDRPVLLASAARLADRGGRHARAAAFRERLVQNHPASSQAPEALLDLARYHASSGGGAERAIELLERLIVQSPESPVVPAARRELERLRSRPSFSSRRRGT